MVICACAMVRSPARRLRRSGKLAKSRRRGKARKKAIAVAGSLMMLRGDVIGDPERAYGRCICDDGSARGSLRGQARPAGIGAAGILVKVLDQEVDEAADLRRKMVAMRVDRVDGVLGHRNETARFDLVDQQKA